ncbi:TetR/AcrR family transcriptional regulator [Nocardia wallacei]|uniref:TetR/AcrR family transcriptional regulator n=1 Tax=Nocardia wallacei TaxID=480035 RepID=UPI002455A1CA|nr:helix-turn-helix domain-containing protein [Nocardia wallacei]
MGSSDAAEHDLPVRAGYSAVKQRTIDTALRLFSEHGVSGTSLQMIADALGVTKAAVYHQFRSKDDIVLAVTQGELAWIEEAVEAAEAEACSTRARENLLTQIVELAVQRRKLVGLLQSDPVIVRLLAGYEPFQMVIERLFAVLIGDTDDPDIRVKTAMMSAAIGGAAIHPLVVDLDDQTLQRHLLDLTHRLFQLPD